MPSTSNQQFNASVGGGRAAQMLTGSRIHIRLGGKVFGKGTIGSYTETRTHDPVFILDQMEVDEWVPVGYDVAFTASRIVLIKRSLKERGWVAKWPSGSTSNTLLDKLLSLGDTTVDIVDQREGTLVSIQGVKIVSNTMTFGARAIVGEDIGFVGTRVVDIGAEG